MVGSGRTRLDAVGFGWSAERLLGPISARICNPLYRRVAPGQAQNASAIGPFTLILATSKKPRLKFNQCEKESGQSISGRTKAAFGRLPVSPLILMKRISYLIPVFALFIVSVSGVIAQERVFSAQNCAITPSASLHEVTNIPPQTGRCAAFDDTTNTRLLLILAGSGLKSPVPVNDHFGAYFERMVERGGLGKFMGKLVSGKVIEVQGIKSYERLGEGVLNGRNATTIVQFVPVDGIAYELHAIRFEGDANTDPEIRQTLASFRFISPPSPPRQTAYRVGYMIGQLIVLTVIGLIVAAVIAFIIRQTGASRGKVPPPLPPNPHQ